jgi:ribosomal protein S18 acetylase RimI-like enzyme
MSRVTLRDAGPKDADFAFAVRAAAFSKYLEAAGGWNEVEERRLHERRFATQRFLVLSVDGASVGILAMSVRPDSMILHQLMILPEYQSHGVGTRCMGLVLEEARQLGVPVRLRVMKVNPRAIAFYERLGFVQVGETSSHYLFERVS